MNSDTHADELTKAQGTIKALEALIDIAAADVERQADKRAKAAQKRRELIDRLGPGCYWLLDDLEKLESISTGGDWKEDARRDIRREMYRTAKRNITREQWRELTHDYRKWNANAHANCPNVCGEDDAYLERLDYSQSCWKMENPLPAAALGAFHDFDDPAYRIGYTYHTDEGREFYRRQIRDNLDHKYTNRWTNPTTHRRNRKGTR